MGLWVEVDSDLPDHPKSLRLAEILGEPRAWARVVQLWMWAVRYAPSGDLSPFTPGQIARAMGYEKGGPDNGADPVAALRECGVTGDRGFLDLDHKLHGWNERTGGKLKKRQRVKRLNRKRQSRHRHALVTRDKRTVPDLTVPDQDQDLTPPTPPPLARKGGALSGLETQADRDRLKAYDEAKAEKRESGRPRRQPCSEKRKQRARETRKETRVGAQQPPVSWMDGPMPPFAGGAPGPQPPKATEITEAMERDVRDLAPVVGHKAEAVLETCRRERRTPESWIRWARMEAQRLQKLSPEKQPA